MLLKKYLYLNIIKNRLNFNLIIFNKKFNLYFLLNIKYIFNIKNIFLKKIIKYFFYQNGLKHLYLSHWHLFGIKNNLISELLKI